MKKISKNKKTIITAIVICLSLIILYFCVSPILSLFKEETPTEERKIYFYPIEEETDITKDKKYMALDRNFYFSDPSTGMTVSFDPEVMADIPEEYKMPLTALVRYVNHATYGEVEELNEMFSDVYFENGFKKKLDFTPQKIYETYFTFYDEDTVTEELGTWTRWRFWVEYKIYKNNGTFRDDMGSDCTRKEFFVITYRDGKLEIDGITPYKTSN